MMTDKALEVQAAYVERVYRRAVALSEKMVGPARGSDDGADDVRRQYIFELSKLLFSAIISGEPDVFELGVQE